MHKATIEAGVHVSRFLGILGMTVAADVLPLLRRGLGGGFLGKLGMTVLFMLCVPAAVLSAQSGNGVKVENFVVAPAGGTVTFEVSWRTPMPVEVWSDSVWVFVDYNDNGTMRRLPLTGATLTATSAPGIGRVKVEDNNNKGVWVIGNAKTAGAGNFSAKVELYYNSATVVAGACVYASNYPPVGEYLTDGRITFTGTPNYEIEFKRTNGDLFNNVSAGTYTIVAGETVKSFTDKTGAPGVMKCMLMTGGLDFSVPGAVSKGQQVTFSVAESPSVPDASAVTYAWSAPAFSPVDGTGASFSTAAPAEVGTYPVTLTASSEAYCDKLVVNDVTVVNCPLAGRLGSGLPCAGNSGGRIGI
jgi:hypothetical protein